MPWVIKLLYVGWLLHGGIVVIPRLADGGVVEKLYTDSMHYIPSNYNATASGSDPVVLMCLAMYITFRRETISASQDRQLAHKKTPGQLSRIHAIIFYPNKYPPFPFPSP